MNYKTNVVSSPVLIQVIVSAIEMDYYNGLRIEENPKYIILVKLVLNIKNIAELNTLADYIEENIRDLDLKEILTQLISKTAVKDSLFQKPIEEFANKIARFLGL